MQELQEYTLTFTSYLSKRSVNLLYQEIGFGLTQLVLEKKTTLNVFGFFYIPIDDVKIVYPNTFLRINDKLASA